MLATLTAPACPQPVYQGPPVFQRKYRYTYEGVFGLIEWPENFVKVMCPADLEKESGTLELMIFEVDQKLSKLARRYQRLVLVSENPERYTGMATVRQYDGCGTELARWRLDGCRMDIEVQVEDENWANIAILAEFQNLQRVR